MEQITVNRFKVYRQMRWYRSNYLWMHRLNPYLEKYNINVRDDSNLPCDVLAIPLPHLPGKEDYSHRDELLTINHGLRGDMDFRDTPILCDSSMDYSYIDPVIAQLLHYPQVKCYTPNVSFRNGIVQQRDSWGGEYYGACVRNLHYYGMGAPTRIIKPPMLEDVAKKIVKPFRPVTPPFYDEVQEWITNKGIKPLKDRKIDIFFSGRLNYHPNPVANFPSINRNWLKDKWDDLPGKKFWLDYDNFQGNKSSGKPVKSLTYPYEYCEHLLNSKIVVSPYGWGSWTVRDIEALLCGCIVVKQPCHNTLIWPDIYHPKHNFFVHVDLRWDGLEGAVTYCLKNLDEMQQRALEGREFLLEHLYPLSKVYERFASHMRVLLERCLEPQYSTAELIPDIERCYL